MSAGHIYSVSIEAMRQPLKLKKVERYHYGVPIFEFFIKSGSIFGYSRSCFLTQIHGS